MKYPIGIQSFESLRKENYVYVDKTEMVYELAERGKYYFLSRPRRFGKSLLVSTIEAYFSGRKDLFKGLAIDELEKDWECHPILHLDLNTERYNTVDSLTDKLEANLNDWEQLYGKNPVAKSFATRFEYVIRYAYEKTGHPVVILVDEYDKPMLQAIGNEELQNEYRGILKGFYGASDMKVLNYGIRKEFTDRVAPDVAFKNNRLTKEQIVEDILRVVK